MRLGNGSELKALISAAMIGIALAFLAFGVAFSYALKQNNKMENMAKSLMAAQPDIIIMQNIQSTQGVASPH